MARWGGCLRASNASAILIATITITITAIRTITVIVVLIIREVEGDLRGWHFTVGSLVNIHDVSAATPHAARQAGIHTPPATQGRPHTYWALRDPAGDATVVSSCTADSGWTRPELAASEEAGGLWDARDEVAPARRKVSTALLPPSVDAAARSIKCPIVCGVSTSTHTHTQPHTQVMHLWAVRDPQEGDMQGQTTHRDGQLIHTSAVD